MVDRLGLQERLLAIRLEERKHYVLTSLGISLVNLPPKTDFTYVFEPPLLHIPMKKFALVLLWRFGFEVILFFRRSHFFCRRIVTDAVPLLSPSHRIDKGHVIPVHDQVQQVTAIAGTEVHPLARLISIEIHRHASALLTLDAANFVAARFNATVWIKLVAKTCCMWCQLIR